MVYEEPERIEKALSEVRRSIEEHSGCAGRDPSGIRLIVVTKKHGTGTIRLLALRGILDVGESYVGEFRAKYPEVDGLGLRWHFIGHLHRKNTPKVVGKAEFIHSVDTIKLARKIDLTAGRMGIVQKVLLQVNTSGEDRKQGFSPHEVTRKEFIDEMSALGNIEVRGLMTMAPFTDDDVVVRNCFRSLRVQREELSRMSGWAVDELSMGMSGDHGIAVEEGATMLRIGTAILGERKR